MRYLFVLGALILSGCIGLESKKNIARDDSGTSSGAIEATPTSIDFGEVQIDDVARETLTLNNVGTRNVALLSASVDGMEGAVEYSTTTGMPSDVTAAGSVVFTLEFAPTDAIYYSGSFDAVFDDAGVELTVSVPLTGAGVRHGTDDTGDTGGDDTGDTGTGDGTLDFTPDSVDFGEVDIGHTSTKSLEVENVGTEDILIDSIITGDSELTVSPSFSLPYVLAPHVLKEIDVNYEPSAKGTLNSWIEFQTDDTDNPNVRVTVTGEGADICDICAPVISVNTGGKDPHTLMGFWYSIAWAIPSTLPVTISNEGDEDLEITDVTITNDTLFPAGTFTTDWSAGSPIAPWDTRTFNVTLTATAVGYEIPNAYTDENYLHIISNDPAEPDYAIALWGMATK